MSAPHPIALHPEAVPDEPLDVRWVVPPGTLSFAGGVLRAPAALQQLITDGVLSTVVVEPDSIRTRLGAGRSWRAEGALVRDAVSAAAADPTGWTPAAGGTGDALLRAVVEQVLAGEVGDYVRSHGGALELVSVEEGRVGMRFSGTCAHCPASGFTLTGRFEAAVRSRYPDLAGIDTVRTPASDTGARFIGIPLLRRR